LANETVGLDDATGQKMYNAIRNPNSSAGKQLRNLLDQSKNGLYMIN